MKTRILTRVLGILEIKNSNQGRRSNNNWNTTNASSDDGVNEGSNENFDGIGGGNWRGGYQGKVAPTKVTLEVDIFGVEENTMALV